MIYAVKWRNLCSLSFWKNAATARVTWFKFSTLMELFTVCAQLECWTAKLKTFHSILSSPNRQIMTKQILVLIASTLLCNSFSPISLCQRFTLPYLFFLHRRRVLTLRGGLHAWLGLHPTASAGTGAATHHRNLGCSRATSMTQVWVYKWSGTRRHVVPSPPPADPHDNPGLCTCTHRIKWQRYTTASFC